MNTSYVQIAVATIFIFGAFFVIGSFLRGAIMGDSASITMLIFFAIVALAGGLSGAFYGGVVARHNVERLAPK